MLAKIENVDELPLGTELELDAAAAATAITVSDINAMDWDGGQLAMADLETKDYTVAGVEDPESDEIDSDDDPDPETGVLNLSASLAFGPYPAGTPVLLYPLTFERIAYCSVEDQDEPVEAKVPDPLLDRLVTGTRSDETAETVEIELVDDEWQVTDLVGEQQPGFSRGYVTNDGPVAPVTTTNPLAPEVICSVPIEIPTTQHRLVVSYFARLDVTGANSVFLAFDDEGIDFPVGELTLAVQNASVSSGVHDALPLLPLVGQGTAYVRAGGVNVSAGLQALATAFLPYTLDVPTVGLHNFRLVAYVDGGTGTVTDTRMWATVI